MTKNEFEDLLRRPGKIARERDFFLIGSQSLRGVCPAIPRDFPQTVEADLYPRRHPQGWSLLRAQLGNQSRFFKQRGYYLDCTDPGLATLPEGWTERLIPFRTARTGGVTAWCLEPHDLFASKLAAWRNKDREFLSAMLRHKLVRPGVILSRIETLAVAKSVQTEMNGLLAQLVQSARAEKQKRK